VPALGPPLQLPLLLPGGPVHRNASAWANPVVVVGGGPIARPGGLQRTSLPFLTRLWGRSGPLPFWAVLTMKFAPPVLAETFWAQWISSIVQLMCVSLVKNPRMFRTPAAFRTLAV
jgi:hypothetical protein